MNLKLLAQIALSSSMCHMNLPILCPILFYQCGCHSSSSDATACRSLHSWDPQMHSLHLFLLELFLLFHTLCLGDWVSVCIHPCLTRQGSLDNCCDSLSTFSVVWVLPLFRATAALHNPDNFQCDREPRCLQITRRKSSRFHHWNALNYHPWQWSSRSFPVRCNFFVNFNSKATICHVVPHKSSQFAAPNASFSGCLVQLLPRTTPFLVKHKTALV